MQRVVAALRLDWPERKRLHHGLMLGGLVVVYFLAGKLGLHFAFVHASASPVWPPTGIALAAVLLLGVRVWPAIFVGAFLVNISIDGAIVSSIGIAAGNTLEAVIGALLVERYAGGAHAFERARNFLRFVVLAGLLSTATSATIGVTMLAVTGEAAWSSFGSIWLTWWLGDAAGALIVAPLLVLWATTPTGILRERPFEALLLFFVVAATGALVFAHPALRHYPLPFLCIPPLIWAAFRFGQREVATSVAVLATIATWATVRGTGPFVMGSDNESLLVLQAFMGTIAALTLPVAALVWERKAIEQERSSLLRLEQAARAEAEVANRAKDDFIAMLSHELRNPLGAISTAAEVLRIAGSNPSFAGRAVEIIGRQSKHLSRLIDDLLDVARVASGKIVLVREKVDLADVVERCLATLRGSGRLQQHRITVKAMPAWVNGDPVRLSQIVDNLLQNAIKYTPPDGQIDVHTLLEDGAAVLRIRDNGIGIAADLLPRIFELFVQGTRSLDRSQGGLGIGLTLSHRLVQAHGGSISAASDGPSKGCTFTVSLPAIETPYAKAPTLHPAAGNGRGRRILIIEDDADSRESMRMQLASAGHDVYEAANGTEGLAAAAHVKPEVVLLDLGLPGLDGYQVAQQLRASDGCPRLIAITGYGQPQDRARSIVAGFDHHLVKPFDAAELRRLLA